jgi:hypothetical protein
MEYANSHIVLTRRLADYTTWGKEEIETRARELANLASRIWIGPATATVLPSGLKPDLREEHHVGERYLLRWRYWTAFREFLLHNGSQVTPPEPAFAYWRPFPMPFTGVVLWASTSLRHRRISVGLTMRGKRGKPLFYRLREVKETVEEAIGGEFHWAEEPGKSFSFIEICLPDSSPAEEAAWPMQHEWLKEKLEAIYRHIPPLLDNPAGTSNHASV